MLDGSSIGYSPKGLNFYLELWHKIARTQKGGSRMAYEDFTFNVCPRCGGPVTTQVTMKSTRIVKCKKKIDGGCGFFVNLGPVKKKVPENVPAQENEPTKIAEQNPQPASGENIAPRGVERLHEHAPERVDRKQPAKKRVPVGRRKPVRKSERKQPERAPEHKPEDKPKRRGFFSALADF